MRGMLGFAVRGKLVTYPGDGLAVDEYVRGTIDYRGGRKTRMIRTQVTQQHHLLAAHGFAPCFFLDARKSSGFLDGHSCPYANFVHASKVPYSAKKKCINITLPHKGIPLHDRYRSEEHTSELQSREN